jgi:YD repeat-containing protein
MPALPGVTLLQGQTVRIDPFGELVKPAPISEIAVTLNKLDNYEANETDQHERHEQWQWDLAGQLMGQFLIDRRQRPMGGYRVY